MEVGIRNIKFVVLYIYMIKCFSVFPKTDYTYSAKSQCRYEIAPGILAMPNMSRRSIHSDTSGAYDSTSMEKERESDVNISTVSVQATFNIHDHLKC